MVFKTTLQNLNQLKNILTQINNNDLCKKLPVLSYSSIGMHIRHVLEFYTCLIEARQTKIINYDSRKRNTELENDIDICVFSIDDIIKNINTFNDDEELTLIADYSKDENKKEAITLKTSLYRELLYNIEHCTHHMAIIKIGLKALEKEISINEGFGVASSTIRNNKKCAQ